MPRLKRMLWLPMNASHCIKRKKLVALFVVSSFTLFMALPNVFAIANLSPTDFFAIPDYNSRINYAYNGSYSNAVFENNFWSFSGLTLSGLGSSVGKSHYLEVSAQNSNITIIHIDTLTSLNQVGWLSYNVEGVGNQTFNMHWISEGFVTGFKVYIDGSAKERNDGWILMPGENPVTDNMLTVIGAKYNVSIGYAVNPETIGPEPNFQPSPVLPSRSPTSSPNLSQIPQQNQNSTLTLVPSPSIPEFSTLSILSLSLFTMMVLTVMIYKRKTAQYV